jgi:hypothetical protein
MNKYPVELLICEMAVDYFCLLSGCDYWIYLIYLGQGLVWVRIRHRMLIVLDPAKSCFKSLVDSMLDVVR